MSRILAVLVLILAAVILVPTLRERAGPQIEWALTPMYRWETKNRVNDVMRVLARERAQGATLPRPRDFERFMEARTGSPMARDPWGEPLFLEVSREGFRIGSTGQDRLRGTPDDILSQLSPAMGR
jgi:hypothetical protein